MRLIMDLEVGRIEDMGFGYKLSANGTVIPPKTTDVVYQKPQGISDITYKERNDEVYDRNKGALVIAPAKMSLELPQAKSYDAGDLFEDNDSLNMTYSRVQGKKDGMNECLREIVEKNERQAVLSDKIEKESKEAAELDEEVSKLEYKANMNKSYAQAIASVGKALKVLGFGAAVLAAVGPLGAVAGVVGAIGGVIGAVLDQDVQNTGSVQHVALEWLTGAPQLRAAVKKLEADKMKAEVQSMRDEQNRISTEISVDQNKFSMLSQSYSVFVSIMQTIISAFNDAKRAITGNMR